MTASEHAGARVSRLREQFDGPAVPAIDVRPLLGSWVNYDRDTSGICRVDLIERDGSVFITIFGADHPYSKNWGERPVRMFSDDVSRSEAFGFSTEYDFAHQRVIVVGYVNRGLLTVEPGSTYIDDSGRSAYFTRAHMHRST
ncbi:MAG: hypothetical protein ACRDPT_03855 [Streptomycetales bacterium]